MSGTRYSESTLDQYMRMVARWQNAGRPVPEEWVPTLTSETQHTARSALLWYHRETGGNVLDLPAPPKVERVPRALTVDQVTGVLEAMFAFNPRAGYTAALLYATGARLGDASRARSVRSDREACQPTMNRLNTSTTKAT